jgi:hypothetical protein
MHFGTPPILNHVGKLAAPDPLRAAAQDRESWRKLATRLPLEPVGTKAISEHGTGEQAQTERTQRQSQHWALPKKYGMVWFAAGDGRVRVRDVLLG